MTTAFIGCSSSGVNGRRRPLLTASRGAARWGEALPTSSRADLIVRRAQKTLEKIMQVRHAIWKKVLAEQQTGLDAPDSVLVGLEGRGVAIDQYLPDGKITAQLLDGPFRFKPYGSVETADLTRQRNNWVGMMQAFPMLLQMFPFLAQQFQTPQAGRAISLQCHEPVCRPSPIPSL